MQKKTKIALAAGVAGLLALGGLAGVASADGGWGKRHGMGHGMGYGMDHGMGMRGMAMQMMERYDANKDGKVELQEMTSKPNPASASTSRRR